jgi:hypothetical protein
MSSASAWKPVNLTALWPVNKIPVSMQEMEYVFTVDINPNKWGGCLLQEIKSTSLSTRICIPLHYRNALKLIGAKIKYLQQALLIPEPQGLETAKKPIWENIHDAFKRNLIFHAGVVEDFIAEVAAAFYDSQTPSLSKPIHHFTNDFHSETMDSWLYVEYYAANHCPPIYDEYEKVEVCEQDPWTIGKKGMSLVCDEE